MEFNQTGWPVKTLVSVAMCTFNGARYLPEQLTSLLRQNHSLIEIIIVDDKSSDHTEKIVRQFQAIDDRIRFYVNSERRGVNKNFEKAISLAKGEYICTCDQDDLWFPEKIEKLLACIGDDDLVYSDSQYILNKGEIIDRFLSSDAKIGNISGPLSLLFFNVVSGHSMMFRKSLFERACPFPDNQYYDHWLAFNAAITGKVRFLDVPLQYYRQHESNVVAAKGFKKKPKEKPDEYEKRAVRTQCLERKIEQLLPGSQERNIAVAILDTYRHNHFLNRIRRALLFFAHRNELLALKRGGRIYQFRYCLKMMRKFV